MHLNDYNDNDLLFVDHLLIYKRLINAMEENDNEALDIIHAAINKMVTCTPSDVPLQGTYLYVKDIKRAFCRENENPIVAT